MLNIEELLDMPEKIKIILYSLIKEYGHKKFEYSTSIESTGYDEEDSSFRIMYIKNLYYGDMLINRTYDVKEDGLPNYTTGMYLGEINKLIADKQEELTENERLCYYKDYCDKILSYHEIYTPTIVTEKGCLDKNDLLEQKLEKMINDNLKKYRIEEINFSDENALAQTLGSKLHELKLKMGEEKRLIHKESEVKETPQEEQTYRKYETKKQIKQEIEKVNEEINKEYGIMIEEENNIQTVDISINKLRKKELKKLRSVLISTKNNLSNKLNDCQKKYNEILHKVVYNPNSNGIISAFGYGYSESSDPTGDLYYTYMYIKRANNDNWIPIYFKEEGTSDGWCRDSDYTAYHDNLKAFELSEDEINCLKSFVNIDNAAKNMLEVYIKNHNSYNNNCTEWQYKRCVPFFPYKNYQANK